MIEQQSDMFAAVAQHRADALCITTNGIVRRDGRAVMGAGTAEAAAARWPDLPRLLAVVLHTIGNHSVPLKYVPESSLWVVSFPTKHHWKDPSDLMLIGASCREVVQLAEIYCWKKVILPRPGCLNGGLTWSEVRPTLARHLDNRFIVVYQ